jgi:hypothetical protein
MTGKRIFYPLLAFWEACRLVVLIIILDRLLSADLFSTGNALIVILLLANGSLIVPAGALYLFITNKHSTPLVLAVGAAKAAGIFTCLLGFGMVVVAIFRSLSVMAPNFPLLLEGAAYLIIFLIDLIFLVRLLSLKGEGGVD